MDLRLLRRAPKPDLRAWRAVCGSSNKVIPKHILRVLGVEAANNAVSGVLSGVIYG
jgi:hypothetical protein